MWKEYDNYKHKVRCKLHFYDTSNKTELTKREVKPQSRPNNKQPNKVDPKCKIADVEMLFSKIEQDIYSDNLRIKFKSNINKAEKQALNKWKENMNKKTADQP